MHVNAGGTNHKAKTSEEGKKKKELDISTADNSGKNEI